MRKTREGLGAEETVVEKIKKRRLLWFGHVHVEWMEGERLPIAAMRKGGKRTERQRNILMDNVREDLKEKTLI